VMLDRPGGQFLVVGRVPASPIRPRPATGADPCNNVPPDHRPAGRLGWQRATGYGRRSLAETAMFRYRTLIGRRLRARSLPGQKAEARMGCAVINRMTQLGMPVSCRVS